MRVEFWSPEDAQTGWLCNLSDHPITFNGRCYKSVEHCYQAQKFTDDKALFERVVNAENPLDAKQVSREFPNRVREDWMAVREDIMMEAVTAKFQQHSDLHTKLLRTECADLVEVCPSAVNDTFWAVNRKTGLGKNVMGKILMKVRHTLGGWDDKKALKSTMHSDTGTFKIVVFHGMKHCAIELGNRPTDFDGPVFVRVHSRCLTSEVFGSSHCDCREQLQNAMHSFGHKYGVILYLDQEGRNQGIARKIQAYKMRETLDIDTYEAYTRMGIEVDARGNYNEAAEMLRRLGISKVVLLTNNPDKMNGLERNGIQVTKRVGLTATINEFNHGYFKCKVGKMNHFDSLLKPQVV